MSESPIEPSEHEIVGRWTFENGVALADEACIRIDKLVRGYLVEVAASPIWGGWELLFRDPADGRYWERVYPEGDSYGGGPPSLRVIDFDTASEKYRLK